MNGDRPITVTLTERELHAVCNAADFAVFIHKQRGDDTEGWRQVRDVTEKMRVAWVEQVTAPALHREDSPS